MAIFLTSEATRRQRSAIGSALANDKRVSSSVFENREQAYDKFRKLWADSPDFVASVTPDSLPESFRVRLADTSRYAAFHTDYAAMGGVQDIVGRVCPPSAPIGGVR
ncbi:permease-like cell division protein FtsX [Actinoplanes sp. NPDC049596]|uniref:permease-like cell division protein FtsX n=1 Tax=unclassified Actinoplanes TaxID=2626549 RepID=UPI00341CB3B0